MKRIIYAILSILISAPALYAEKAVNPFTIPVGAFSSSYEYGSFSWMANPVFTDSDMQPDMAYRYTRTEGNPSHHAMINLFGFAIGYSRYAEIYNPENEIFHNAGADIFHVSRGFILGDVFGFGIGYSFCTGGHSGYDDYHGWNAGLLFRPFSFVSFGISFRDIAGEIDGNSLRVTQVYSASLRPFGEWFTLSADCVKGSVINDGDTFYSFSGEVRAWYNVTLCFSADTNRNFSAGITIPFDTRISAPVNISMDYYGSYNRNYPDFISAGAAVRFRHTGGVNINVAGNILFIPLADSYDENGTKGFFAENKPEFIELINGIMTAADDPSIEAIVIEIGNLDMGFAQAQEIRRVLKVFKQKGKKVYAILNDTGNKQYFIASCADRIFLTPNSEFAITGLKISLYYFKGLLDKIGIQYESIRRGDYKSFNEPFTREGMSPEAEANLREILTDLNEQFISAITERTLISRDKVKKLFETGFYTPDEAKAEGFIDEVMYSEDAIDSISSGAVLVKFDSYRSENRSSGIWGRPPVIAIIYVTGNIVPGRGRQDGMAGSTGNTDYAESLERAFKDPGVKGVVIRIDSGGGSAAASDFMWKSLVHLKKKFPKPVVISFGNTAASGGYYVACTGDRIFAENGTITGSIGVISGKISAKELYAKLGISKQTISLSEFADIFDESRPLTQNEYKVIDRATGFIYDRFKQKVIEARKIPASEIEKIAGGRIHTGKGGRTNGLVDEEGGIFAAIQFCRSQCGITGEFRVIQLPDNSGFFSGMEDRFFSADNAVIDMFIRGTQIFGLADDGALYLEPYYIEIE